MIREELFYAEITTFLEDEEVEAMVFPNELAAGLAKRLAKLSLPPAEGAEEILDAKEIYLDLCFKNIQFEDRLKLVVMAMEKYATLHAQRIADKMVSERLREELIAYEQWMFGQDNAKVTTSYIKEYIDEYLKARSHD